MVNITYISVINDKKRFMKPLTIKFSYKVNGSYLNVYMKSELKMMFIIRDLKSHSLKILNI